MFIGKVMLDHGFIKPWQLANALEIQSNSHGLLPQPDTRRIGEILMSLNYLTSAQVTLCLAKQLGLTFIELDRNFLLTAELYALFTPTKIINSSFLPICLSNHLVTLAFGNTDDIFTVADLNIRPLRTSIVLADPLAILNIKKRFYPQHFPSSIFY